MKTQRRHELQTNVLADWLGKTIDQVRPFSKTIAGVVIVLCALGFAYLFLNRDQSAKSGPGWSAYYAAVSQSALEADPGELEKVAKLYDGTEPGLWARQRIGDMELAEGSRTLLVNREDAESALERAKKAYQDVDSVQSIPPMLRHRAWYGLAQASECLSVASGDNRKNRKELEEAKSYYERLVKEIPDSALGRSARERIELIDKLGAEDWSPEKNDYSPKNWYSWLAQNKPPSFDSSDDTAPGFNDFLDRPLEMDDLPDRPDISPPSPDQGERDPADADRSGEEAKPEGASSSDSTSKSSPATPDGAKADGAEPEKAPADRSTTPPTDQSPGAASPAEPPTGASPATGQ